MSAPSHHTCQTGGLPTTEQQKVRGGVGGDWKHHIDGLDLTEVGGVGFQSAWGGDSADYLY